MPHAALWVVQRSRNRLHAVCVISFNAARDFVGGATVLAFLGEFIHSSFNAARGFVGGATELELTEEQEEINRFNAARGFVGGATKMRTALTKGQLLFQCRTRLCGWCNRIARSPCPPMGKKPFWKVSGNLRCLTENI